MPPVAHATLQKLSVVIPALNEGKSIGVVMDELPRGLLEVIVVDGNSTDGTQEIARAKGARVISEPRRGYGRAVMTGMQAARGEFVATLDGDHTYPGEVLGDVVQLLVDRDLDFVTCDRLSTLNSEAMGAKHRFGNWVLSATTRVLFRVPIIDSQSGMCVMRRSILRDLTLGSPTFAFCQELKIEAFRRRRGRCGEIPVRYRSRIGTPQLSSWRDGTANLAFLFKKRLAFVKARRGELYRSVDRPAPLRIDPGFSSMSHASSSAAPSVESREPV